MLETVMKLYAMSMAYDVRSPMPHLVGPPGCGKSSVVEELAELLGVGLHTINVSRLSPLDVEGVQMPHTTGDVMALRMLPATYWTRMKEGDILLMDEFLRGFPEVYNALLDIFTSRKVGSLTLPKVFIIGASNTTVVYDQALEDRLIHIPVADPRKSKSEFDRMAKLLVEKLGLLPSVAKSAEMKDLLTLDVLPMYDMLDAYTKKGVQITRDPKGTSLRNLIGQVQLRQIELVRLKELLDHNNAAALTDGKPQFVIFYREDSLFGEYMEAIEKIRDSPRLTELQRINIEMNIQLVELANARKG